MDPTPANSLVRFCADQYFAFDPEDWIVRAVRGDRAATVAAARYLSQTSWYGRGDDLARIAATLEAAPEAIARGVPATSRHDLNLSRFAAVLRLDIASRRLLAREFSGAGAADSQLRH